MIKSLPFVYLFAVLLCLSLEACTPKDSITPPLLINYEHLLESKARIEKGEPALMPAFRQLIVDADRMLGEGPFTVTHKTKPAPSGDKHDYASYSRYWWPDPEKADGLPYIRRDGETNPASQSPDEADRPRIGSFGINTETLGLAYFLTGKEVYARKAAELLRVWFLNESTKMNPNLNHAQCRPGHNTGTKSGVLDGRLMIRALEGSALISGSAEWSEAESAGLKSWAQDYFDWLTTSKLALEEAASSNNHGSYYDLQTSYFALYSGNHVAAKNIVREVLHNRVYSQILPDGSMPREQERTRPLFYSIYNLHALLLVAQLAEKVDVDLWEAGNKNARLRAALDYLAPYADSSKNWPHPTIGETDRMELFSILKMASRAYPDQNYLQMVEQLPIERRKTHISNLAFPLMR